MIPHGLLYLDDFLSEEEASSVMSTLPGFVDDQKLVYRYGSRVYKGNHASETIPESLERLGAKLVAHGFLTSKPKHITVNCYGVGSEIGPHIDKPESGEVVTIVSLLGEARMVLSRLEESYELAVRPNSLTQLSLEARYDWTHAIPAVQNRRYSIVFRD